MWLTRLALRNPVFILMMSLMTGVLGYVGLKRLSVDLFPEINVQIGTQYFRDLIDKYGGAHFALASYNAGEARVDRWTEERPGIPQDEFIDDIPFPETQTYVKRILGTAEDYRRLYAN